jgi:hypothetical protein
MDSLIRDLGGVIENSDFGENVLLEFRVKSEMKDKLFKNCADLTNGKFTPLECGTVIAEG